MRITFRIRRGFIKFKLAQICPSVHCGKVNISGKLCLLNLSALHASLQAKYTIAVVDIEIKILQEILLRRRDEKI